MWILDLYGKTMHNGCGVSFSALSSDVTTSFHNSLHSVTLFTFGAGQTTAQPFGFPTLLLVAYIAIHFE